MVSWYWILIGYFVGLFSGVMLIALLSANGRD